MVMSTHSLTLATDRRAQMASAQQPWQHLFCLICGALALPWNLVVHCIPYEWIPLGSWAGGMDESEVDNLLAAAKEEENTDK